MDHPTDHVELRPGAYADSVALLQVSRDVQAVTGVVTAQVAMATPLNLDVLAQMGFSISESTPNDMVVAIRLEPAHGDSLVTALTAVEAALAAQQRRSTPNADAAAARHRTTATALRERAGDLVLVSVPGPSAALETMDALEAGCDVMVFSDNVPLDQEVSLKQAASARALLVMGPDCGTAVVDGVGLGFANATDPGPVGLVAASGTGCQQLLALLDHAGVGIASALGVGGRDLSAAVGGLSTLEAMRRQDADPAVELVVVVSKPPAEEVASAIRAYAESLRTPVVLALLGPGTPDLTQAAEEVLVRLGRPVPDWPVVSTTLEVRPVPGLLHGYFVGGTLRDEASQIIAASPPEPVEADLVDFGADELTQGRAHPMIDPTLRLERVASVTDGVLLLDVVLGHGAEPDPAAALAPAVAAAGRRGVPVVLSCVGTAGDPQGLMAQVAALAEAGAEVHVSNAGAVRRAVALARGAGTGSPR